MTGIFAVLTALKLLFPLAIQTFQELHQHNLVSGFSDLSELIGKIAFLFHLHLRFNFFGFDVDSGIPSASVAPKVTIKQIANPFQRKV